MLTTHLSEHDFLFGRGGGYPIGYEKWIKYQHGSGGGESYGWKGGMDDEEIYSFKESLTFGFSSDRMYHQ